MKKLKIKDEDIGMLRGILNTYPRMEDEDRFSKGWNKRLERLAKRILEQL